MFRKKPLLCRWGWHRWRFAGMTDLRDLVLPGMTVWVGTMTQSCRRCARTRVIEDAKVPWRVE